MGQMLGVERALLSTAGPLWDTFQNGHDGAVVLLDWRVGFNIV